MIRIFALIIIFLAAGCDSKEVKQQYQDHPFDQRVIEKLPIYDSLCAVLIRNFPFYQKEILENNAFKLVFTRDSSGIYKQLPKEASLKINQYYRQLGTDFIYRLDIYKDSSIRISIRDTFIEKSKINIGERLSFFPDSTGIRKREFPTKDTILNHQWQYWISFNEEIGFF
jgi:hypothetical protein